MTWGAWEIFSEYLRHGIIDVVFLIFPFMLVMSYRQALISCCSTFRSGGFGNPWPGQSSRQAGAKFVIYEFFSQSWFSDTGAAPHSDRRQNWNWHLRIKIERFRGHIMFSFHSTFHVDVGSELRNVYLLAIRFWLPFKPSWLLTINWFYIHISFSLFKLWSVNKIHH